MSNAGMSRSVPLSISAFIGVAVLAACSSPDVGRLVEYQSGAGGVVVLDKTVPGEVIAFDDIVFCKEGGGLVEIERVELVESNGGLSVLTFSVLPAGEVGESLTHLSNPRQRLADAGYPTLGPMIVDRECPTEVPDSRAGAVTGYSVLGFEVQRDGAMPGTARGIRVQYSSQGEVFSAVYPLGVVLCDDLYPAGPDAEVNEQCVIEQLTSW
jgi:hypothetical protein